MSNTSLLWWGKFTVPYTFLEEVKTVASCQLFHGGWGRHLYTCFYLGQWMGFKWETTPWSTLQQKGLWCSDLLLAQQALLACALPAVLGIAPDLTLGWAPPQVRCPESVHTRTWGAPAAEGRRLWMCLAESRETAGSHSKVSCQISHFIWLQSPCGWNVTSSSSGSFNSWHCCLAVPAQLCVMTTC